ncbi:MAG: prohibitin family protein [Brumimicrobium sp.]
MKFRGKDIKIYHVLFGVIGLFGLILLLASWRSIEPGEEGFMYEPYGKGVIVDEVLNEGMYIIAPWNKLITYDVRQQSKTYSGKFLDKNGMTTTISMAVNYNAKRGETPLLHLEYGEHYFETLIDPKVKGAIKDVIGRYTYEEVYSTKREQLEREMEQILEFDFEGKHVQLDFVRISDVELPAEIEEEIERKETQKQRNKTSELKKIEEKNLAEARVEKAKGMKDSQIIEAEGEAEAIRIKQEELKKSPQYINYMKAEKWDGKLPEFYGGNAGMLFNLDR